MAESSLLRLRDDFIQAIQAKRKISIKFLPRVDAGCSVRKCAPMDYGPSRTAKKKNDKFHMWDYESDSGPHTLSLNPEQIREIKVLDEFFEPAEFVTWNTKEKPWSIRRDWGIYS